MTTEYWAGLDGLPYRLTGWKGGSFSAAPINLISRLAVLFRVANPADALLTLASQKKARD
jgi:hypothetical protein